MEHACNRSSAHSIRDTGTANMTLDGAKARKWIAMPLTRSCPKVWLRKSLFIPSVHGFASSGHRDYGYTRVPSQYSQQEGNESIRWPRTLEPQQHSIVGAFGCAIEKELFVLIFVRLPVQITTWKTVNRKSSRIELSYKMKNINSTLCVS